MITSRVWLHRWRRGTGRGHEHIQDHCFGKHAFREEFVSAFLAYLLSTKMDHGLNFTFLSKLLSRIAEQGNAASLKDLSEHFKCRLWENIFDENEGLPLVEPEFRYPGGFIDIVIKYPRFL